EGEAPLDGLAREFREETGLVVRPLEWLGTHVEPYDNYFVLGLTWLVEADGDPRPADDVEELAWFGPAELPGEMAFPHQSELLRAWAARQLQSYRARLDLEANRRLELGALSVDRDAEPLRMGVDLDTLRDPDLAARRVHMQASPVELLPRSR